MVDLITLIKAGLTDPRRPYAVLFFVGPTGVGKTEIAKTLAEYIFGSADRMIRIDMSEYMGADALEKLIGSPWRADPGMTLPARVRAQPFSVVLLDEVEKANTQVFDLCLQMFDDGRLTDARGHTADFRRTIIVLTSNLASRISEGSMGFGGGGEGGASEEAVLREVKRFFRPEFVNRLRQAGGVQAAVAGGDAHHRPSRARQGLAPLRDRAPAPLGGGGPGGGGPAVSRGFHQRLRSPSAQASRRRPGAGAAVARDREARRGGPRGLAAGRRRGRQDRRQALGGAGPQGGGAAAPGASRRRETAGAQAGRAAGVAGRPRDPGGTAGVAGRARRGRGSQVGDRHRHRRAELLG